MTAPTRIQRKAGRRRWGKKDWILLTANGTMHLLHGKDHPLCRKTMPKGEIIRQPEELDKLRYTKSGLIILEELCRNCQTVFTGER